jgi:hypothetical protein
MSDLLNDSATAVKIRDKILIELRPGEQVFYAAEGQVTEPQPLAHRPNDFHLYVGAIIVTNERLLVAEAKMLGGARFTSLPWADVSEIGRYPDGRVGYKRTLKQGVQWPLWQVHIWAGKSYKTPLDAKALDILAMSSTEAYDAVRQASLAARVDDASSAYEELKRRRTQQ